MLDVVVAWQVVPKVDVLATTLSDGISDRHDPRSLARSSEFSAFQIVPHRIPVDAHELDVVESSVRRQRAERGARHIGRRIWVLPARRLRATTNRRVPNG